MDFKITLNQHSPATVAKHTGQLATMQADWRHRGYLPKTGHHARMDAFGQMSLLIRKLAADRGIGPKLTGEVADYCARAALYHAACDVRFYEGEHALGLDLSARGIKQYRKDNVDQIKLLQELHETGSAYYPSADSPWTARGHDLAGRVVRQLISGAVIMPTDICVWWADDTWEFVRDLNEAYLAALKSSDEMAVPKLAGPVVVFDLRQIAKLFVSRLQKPMAHVQAIPDDRG